METIREILAAHESGISRDGLLAWARLRGDPQMTDAQLEAALAVLGDQVIDVQGFLYLRQFAPASALGSPRTVPPAVTPAPVDEPPAAPPPGPVSTDAPPGWPAPGTIAPPPPPPGSWAPPDGQGGASPEAPTWAPPDGQPGWTPQPSPGGRRTMVIAAVGVFLFLVVAAAGAVLLRQSGDGAEPAVPTPSSGTVIGANDLGVGDCMVLPSEDQFDEIRRLGCTEPHDAEVFLVVDHPGSEYPSNDAFESFIDEQCTPAFASYSGSAYDDQDVLIYGWFTPTPASWDDGDHAVMCYLAPADESPTDRSYRGANP